MTIHHSISNLKNSQNVTKKSQAKEGGKIHVKNTLYL